MNVLIYLPEVDQTWGGVRQYAVGLIKILLSQEQSQHSYYIYHNQRDPEILDLINNNKSVTLVTNGDVNYNPRISPSISRRAINFLFRKLNVHVSEKSNYRTHIELICIKYKINIIHCPYQFIPNMSMTEVKLITTLHDVQELHFPEFFSPEDRAYRANNWLDYLSRADKIIVSYNHVKLDLIKYFSIKPDRIAVILLDMGKLWLDKFSHSDIIDIEKFNLPEKFVFLPANTWQHKNHIRLIQAVAYIRSVNNILINIVCSGNLNKYYYDEIEGQIRDLNLKDQIRFIGIVSERELYSIYKSAMGVIVPTVYEAGSFPLMESILLNIPVICSNVTSLPETVNNDDCLFDPLSVIDIAEKLKLFWESKDFRDSTIKNNEYSEKLLRKTGAVRDFVLVYDSLSNE